MLRVVVDPGVLIAGRLSGKGAPADIIRRWLDGELDIVVSPMLMKELNDVFHRPKFRRRLSIAEADTYVAFLREHATLVSDPPAEEGHTPDPDDDYLVTLAKAVRADALISGDRDLVSIVDLTPPVLTPRAMIDLLEAQWSG